MSTSEQPFASLRRTLAGAEDHECISAGTVRALLANRDELGEKLAAAYEIITDRASNLATCPFCFRNLGWVESGLAMHARNCPALPALQAAETAP